MSGFENLDSVNQSIPDIIFNGLFIYSNSFSAVTLLLIALIIWKYPRRDPHFRYLIITLGTMILAMLGVNEIIAYIPLRRMRYTLVMIPSISIFLSLGVMILYGYHKYLLRIAAIIWMVALGLFSVLPEFQIVTGLSQTRIKDVFPFDKVTQKLQEMNSSLATYPTVVFLDVSQSYNVHNLRYYETIYKASFEHMTLPITDQNRVRLNKIEEHFPGFWFGYFSEDEKIYESWREDRQVQQLLETYAPCITHTIDQRVYLTYYLDARLSCELIIDERPYSIWFNNGYTLQNYQVIYDQSQVDVSMWWEHPQSIYDNSYGYSLQVFLDNEKVGQSDYPIDNIITQTQVQLSIDTPGNYEIWLIVYSSQDVKSSGGKEMNGAVFERSIVIADFEIER